jgi:membrane protein DedA with SNARE-associated domain
MLATGAFASQGYFSVSLALLCATVSNVAIDLILFLISRTYGSRALRLFKVERSPLVVRLEGYVRDTAGLSIFVTRFVGGLDLACTVLAGLANVSTLYFVTFDLLGNAVDYAFFLFIGYFFGAYWQSISNDWGLVGTGIFALVCIAFGVSYWRYRKPKNNTP